jgi:hypothetical protein
MDSFSYILFWSVRCWCIEKLLIFENWFCILLHCWSYLCCLGVLGGVFGSLRYRIMSSSNRDTLTISLPIYIAFISSSCLIALARNSRTIVNRNGHYYFWWGSWVHWHSILILIGMWWFLPFSCFCCLRICEQPNQCYSLITCLFFFYGLILPIFSWFCLLSSVCRIPCRIFCSGGVVVIYCFSFCLLWKIFIVLSILW